jgi:HEAT repeat protein
MALALVGAAGAAAQSIDSEISERVARVQSAPDETMRIEHAAHLAEYIASRGPLDVSNIEAPVVDDMAGLLDDDADLVRFYAAASLGFLGASARRAIPALEEALARREQERGMVVGQPQIFTAAVSSAQAICLALSKIDLSRVPDSCQTYR